MNVVKAEFDTRMWHGAEQSYLFLPPLRTGILLIEVFLLFHTSTHMMKAK